MTKTEIYNLMKDVFEGRVAIDSIEQTEYNEIVSRLDKDITSSEKHGTSTPKVNDAKSVLMRDIVNVLTTSGGALTIPQIIDALGANYEYGEGENVKKLNSQIVSASLSALGTDRGTGEVTRTLIKKVAYFSLT